MKILKPFQTDPRRNAILRGICPQVFGLFAVKLAGMALRFVSMNKNKRKKG